MKLAQGKLIKEVMIMQEKLISWRKFYGITQKEMAEMLGIDVRTYINKEQGISQFKANEMFAIAKILQRDINEIFLPTNFIKHEVKNNSRDVFHRT